MALTIAGSKGQCVGIGFNRVDRLEMAQCRLRCLIVGRRGELVGKEGFEVIWAHPEDAVFKSGMGFGQL